MSGDFWLPPGLVQQIGNGEFAFAGGAVDSLINTGNTSGKIILSNGMDLEAELESLKALMNPNAIVKCQHCGQWAAAYTACKHCGAPVN
jgi:hypothetical protein